MAIENAYIQAKINAFRAKRPKMTYISPIPDQARLELEITPRSSSPRARARLELELDSSSSPTRT